MAHGGVGGGAKPVLLGFVDEFMETSKEHFTTNKIGGFPVSTRYAIHMQVVFGCLIFSARIGTS